MEPNLCCLHAQWSLTFAYCQITGDPFLQTAVPVGWIISLRDLDGVDAGDPLKQIDFGDP